MYDSVGMDLVLISRTQSKLDEVAQEVQDRFGREVLTFAIDLTRLDDSALKMLGQKIDKMDVGVLINNAGMSLDHPEYLEITDVETNKDMIAINALTPTIVRISDHTKSVLGPVSKTVYMWC